MPKILCACQTILRYSDIPCEIQYKFIPDTEYDQYHGSINADELYLKMNSFLKCPDCKRLWVFWNGFENEPTEYIQAPVKTTTKEEF